MSILKHMDTHDTFHNTYVIEIMQGTLLRKSMLIVKSADFSRRIPLHFVARNGDPATAYISDADGFFPIHIAAMMGNICIRSWSAFN